jgi:hypothetical protein
MSSRVSLSLYLTGEETVMRRSGEAERRGESDGRSFACLFVLHTCLCVFEFPLPLLLFLLSCFLSHL